MYVEHKKREEEERQILERSEKARVEYEKKRQLELKRLRKEYVRLTKRNINLQTMRTS